jgi:malate permease and related proteins
MVNVALLVVCFALGMVLRRSGRFPENTPAVLNGFIIHISLPAVILLYVHSLPINTSLVFPVAAPWILFGVGFLVFVTASKFARWSPQTTGGLILSSSLANTSFLGLPMIETYYGVGFLGVGIVIDQLGTYMVLSTLGIIVAVMHSSGQTDTVSLSSVIRKIMKFVPFQALLVALILRAIRFSNRSRAAS